MKSGTRHNNIHDFRVALEAMFIHHADRICLVSSDSDFSHQCRKHREPGTTVYMVSEQKIPDALKCRSMISPLIAETLKTSE